MRRDARSTSSSRRRAMSAHTAASSSLIGMRSPSQRGRDLLRDSLARLDRAHQPALVLLARVLSAEMQIPHRIALVAADAGVLPGRVAGVAAEVERHGGPIHARRAPLVGAAQLGKDAV